MEFGFLLVVDGCLLLFVLSLFEVILILSNDKLILLFLLEPASL